ncbi:MAG: hypothetical protein ACE5JQ_16255 [Candidatus Methylomirabilales bacterium]
MEVKLFPLELDIDGRTIFVAHPWPMNLDECLSGFYQCMAFSWVAISFEKMLVITPITSN